MAISLLRGILNSEDWDLNPLLIANEYLNWYYSRPFDIEMTIDSGIKWIEQYLDKYPNGNHFDKLIYKVTQVNKGFQSNGWLMRATPLSVYWYKLSDSKIYEFTKRDVTLIHSHPTAIQSVVCYNIAIAHLLTCSTILVTQRAPSTESANTSKWSRAKTEATSKTFGNRLSKPSRRQIWSLRKKRSDLCWLRSRTRSFTWRTTTLTKLQSETCCWGAETLTRTQQSSEVCLVPDGDLKQFRKSG